MKINITLTKFETGVFSITYGNNVVMAFNNDYLWTNIPRFNTPDTRSRSEKLENIIDRIVIWENVNRISDIQDLFEDVVHFNDIEYSVMVYDILSLLIKSKYTVSSKIVTHVKQIADVYMLLLRSSVLHIDDDTFKLNDNEKSYVLDRCKDFEKNLDK